MLSAGCGLPSHPRGRGHAHAMEGGYHAPNRAVCDFVTLKLTIQGHWQLMTAWVNRDPPGRSYPSIDVRFASESDMIFARISGTTEPRAL